MKKIFIRAKAVMFDMDGVITDTMPYHYKAWKKVFKAGGFNVSERDIYLREGQPGNVTIKEIFHEHGFRYNERIARSMLVQKEALFKKIVKRRFVRGSRPFVHFLHSKGFKLALVTGTARHEVKRILPAGLLSMFDAIVTGDEVKRGKPHPEPYNNALKKLGIGNDGVVVIENAPFGIQSAKGARLCCLALETSLKKSYLLKADHVFSSYKELKKKVDFLWTL